MKSKVRILGRTLPAWMVGMVLILATSGAATGVVLAGNVTGAVTATASQSLLILQNSGTYISGANKSLITVNDSGTGFHAAAEIHTGDEFKVHLALSNGSNQPLNGELTLTAPDGITLSADGMSASSTPPGDMDGDVVRTGPFTWIYRLNPDAIGHPTSTDLVITVAMADDLPPGFYSIDGTLKQVQQ